MKLLTLLALPLLAAQASAVFVQCTGTSDDAFREPDYKGGIFTLMNAASSRAPNSYTATNQTWLSQGYYSFAMTIPRGTKALSSEACACEGQMRSNMEHKKQVCVCTFGQNNQSAIGVTRIAGKQHQRREYQEPTNAADLWERANKKPKKSEKGVGAVQMPKCS